MSQLLDSLQNSIPFLRKKEEPRTPVGGFYWNELSNLPLKEASMHCLIKGTLIFCLVFGVLHGMFTAFELSYNFVLVFILLLVVSLILSLFHLRKWLFNLGYILTFFNFVSFAISYRIPANSGFQAFINVMTDSFSSYLNLNYEKEYEEILKDRYYTLTVMAIFLGIVCVLVCESLLFYSMHFWPVFLVSMLPWNLCFYVERFPSAFSMFLVFFSLISIYLIKKSTHYKYYTYKSKDGYEPIEVDKKSKFHLHIVRSSNNGMLSICAIAAAIALLFSSVASISSNMYSKADHETTAIKKGFDPYMELMVQQGLIGFFDRYSSKGGLSQGRLGGISSVRPDYMPDLNATFVPYSFEPVYLKAYTSAGYSNNEWLPYDSHFTTDVDLLDFCENLEYNNIKAMIKHKILPSVSAKMKLENKDANPYHSYLPYFTDRSHHYTSLKIGDDITMSYYPLASNVFNYFTQTYNKIVDERTPKELKFMMEYNDHIEDTFLNVPVALQDVCKETCDKIGYANTTYTQACMIRDYFNENYTYSLIPGKTPYNKDFISYFLTNQNKGFCAHFASAATMLLRTYGIPARYCEGYVITRASLADEAEVLDVPITNYLTGQSLISSTGVVNVDIPDANAHAWVEIYVKDFGWVPFEFTPAASDDDSYNGFLSMIGRLFMFGGGQSESDNNAAENNGATQFFSNLQSGFKPAIRFFMILLGIGAILLIIYWFRLFGLRLMKKQKAIQAGDYSYLIGEEYTKTKQYLSKIHPEDTLHYPKDMASFLRNCGDPDIASKAEEMIQKAEKNCYSPDAINANEAHELINYFKLIRTNLKSKKK